MIVPRVFKSRQRKRKNISIVLSSQKKHKDFSHWLIRQYLRNYGVIPIKGVTPFSLLFKRISPLFSVLLFPLYQ